MGIKEKISPSKESKKNPLLKEVLRIEDFRSLNSDPLDRPNGKIKFRNTVIFLKNYFRIQGSFSDISGDNSKS